ncbi:MAG: PAS domain S-box protein, partial [Smithella sp.]
MINKGDEKNIFRALAEKSSDIILLINRGGNIIYENPAIEKIMGYKIEDRIGRPVIENLHPDDLNLINEAFNALMQDQDSPAQNSEIRLRHSDGSWRTFEVVASNLKEGNVVDAVIVNLHDITKRKQTEEELRRTESSLKAAQAQAHIGSWEFDISTGKHFWSDEMYRIFELDPALGAPSFDYLNHMIHPDDIERMENVFKQALAGLKSFHEEHRIILSDGRERFIEANGNAVFDDKNRLVKFIGTSQDITGRKQAEIILREHDERLRVITENLPGTVFQFYAKDNGE